MGGTETAFKNIFNVLWWIGGGFIDAIIYYLIGFILKLTVICKPLGDGFIELGHFSLAPFTRSLIRKDDISRKRRYRWDSTSTTLFYIYLPIGTCIFLLMLFSIYIRIITLYGILGIIPTIKCIFYVLNPIGIKCVSDDVKEKIEKKNRKKELKKIEELDYSYYSSSSGYSSRSPSPAPIHYHDKKKRRY